MGGSLFQNVFQIIVQKLLGDSAGVEQLVSTWLFILKTTRMPCVSVTYTKTSNRCQHTDVNWCPVMQKSVLTIWRHTVPSAVIDTKFNTSAKTQQSAVCGAALSLTCQTKPLTDRQWPLLCLMSTQQRHSLCVYRQLPLRLKHEATLRQITVKKGKSRKGREGTWDGITAFCSNASRSIVAGKAGPVGRTMSGIICVCVFCCMSILSGALEPISCPVAIPSTVGSM